MIFVYTTFPDSETAKRAVQSMLEERKAACINAWPISSAFVDGGRVERGQEVAVLIKTTEHKFADVEEAILKHHPYKTPCVVAFEARRINAAYKEYLSKTVR